MAQPVSNTTENRRFDDLAPGIATTGLLVGVVAIGVSLIFAFMQGWDIFFRSYILNFALFNAVALGALFFTILQYLTTAAWSVVVRRIAEATASVLPWMGVLFIPILVPVLFGMSSIYPWANSKAVEGDHILQHKSAYLSIPFFLVRMFVVFAIWTLLARFYYQNSVEQDRSGDPELTRKMQFWSGPSVIVFAFTLAIYSIDVLKSLNPGWFSTMWPVYIFAGAWMSFNAFLVLVLLFLRSRGRLTTSVTAEHFHDIGKWIFALVVFWTYITFSQFMLIWYANIPEETVWFLQRQKDAWWVGVSLVLLFGQFIFPFLFLVKREVKRNAYSLLFMACWIILMRWVDMYYVVIPRPFTPQGETATAAEPSMWIMPTDILLFVGIGALFVGFVARQLAKASLMPERDPRLSESLAFENL